MNVKQWYESYQHKDINITPYLWRMHDVLDSAVMAIDDKYLSPEKNNRDVKCHKIYKVWSNFSHTFNFKSAKKRIVISLSGGVDSMSLLYTIKNWKSNVGSDIDIIALHINFNNRKESFLEALYLQHWCKMIDVPIYINEITDYKRDNTPRQEYEKMTRDLRFELYNQLMDGYEGGVVLGHIKEDIEENFLRNVLTHVNTFKVLGMEQRSKISGVDVLRPFLNTSKDDIYNFAKKFHIPYFADTTPDWSVRGRFRKKLRPTMQDIFGKKIGDSFIDFGCILHDLGEWFSKNYIKSYRNIIIYNHDTIELPYEREVPDIFWMIVVEEAMYNKNKGKPSHKVMKEIIKIIQNRQERQIVISKGITGEFKNDIFFIRF